MSESSLHVMCKRRQDHIQPRSNDNHSRKMRNPRSVSLCMIERDKDPLTEPYSPPCGRCAFAVVNRYCSVVGHVFCLKCINEWVGVTPRQRRTCTCPSCSAVITKGTSTASV
ncbi:uncharacterized protein BT62DRAFT_209149 [Guyanagaster necrorhizus]|uniref:RING-type domain-containing protein n=1 Tax=Guyanagaster necrorhizus TaxID=856835 RepID=A0A9P8ARH3_9AGAR|nr:uncharacterized protein BT62DRAFT_209149 [Guyanagaster necrorhizus MCA 3950]KAG7445085.1 hypothetical protein BT62DRAFT_209149 [Guyanagaster necrorhizus MCA 3950]